MNLHDPNCRTVLFLCTGNYYRSRFAEIWFNRLAAERNLPWRANSRGVGLDEWPDIPGPISRNTINGLLERGIESDPNPRFPMQAVVSELEQADRIIALKEAEHRHRLADKYPDGWSERVTYWHVHDVDYAQPEQALAEIESLVEDLLAELAN